MSPYLLEQVDKENREKTGQCSPGKMTVKTDVVVPCSVDFILTLTSPLFNAYIGWHISWPAVVMTLILS